MRAMIAMAAATLAVGCAKAPPRLNAPIHGQSDEIADSAGTLAYMNENALLADMSLSDMHFVAHRPMLNTLGVERLTRMADLLQCYGGTIRLATRETDQSLIDERIRHVRNFLEEASLDLQATQVVCDLPGGRGLNAVESIQVLKGEGTYKPRTSAAPAPTMPKLPTP